ncbi:MAG: carboxypeptidase regulatory-like domain-containing protein [Litorilinea sp.]
MPVLLAICALILAACAPAPTANVLGYELKKRLHVYPSPPHTGPTGTLSGQIFNDAQSPIPGAVALIATATGTPYTATTDARGIYTITQIPPGQYVPAFSAPGYVETALHDSVGIPRLLTITGATTTHAPPVRLETYTPPPLPQSLPHAVDLTLRDTYVAQASFPAGATAHVHTYTFTHNAVVINSLRLYLPLAATPQDAVQLPLLFMIYPTDTAAWEDVSVAYAAEGYAFVAISPAAAHGLNIDAHAQDARVAFHLARGGHLTRAIDTASAATIDVAIDPQRAIALGGSFSSAVLHRFLRDEAPNITAWVNVGGISNAFTGAAEFYAGELEMPPAFEYAIPALGPANIYPLPFLRYSPVYSAGYLPPTYIVHTAADRIATIDQAHQLEAALRAAEIPVETLYYTDDSHYLMIGEYMTPASRNVYYGIQDYIRAQFGE